MLIWGGERTSRDGVGYDITHPIEVGAYDPSTDSWKRYETPNNPPGRKDPCLAWSGSELLVWGGWRLSDDIELRYFNELYRFDMGAGRWTQSVAPGAPIGRAANAATWTGEEWVIWGGYSGSDYGSRELLGDGARYSPARDQWVRLNDDHPLGARERPVAVWTGREVLFWCGERQPAVGALYDPSDDAWFTLPTENGPAWLENGNAVWSGESLLAVGGDLFTLDPGGPYSGDLLPDYWQERFFGFGNPEAEPYRDPDQDNWINRHEWLYGTDPVDSRSHPVFQVLANANRVHISLREADPFLGFRVSSSTDLHTWTVPAPLPPLRQAGMLVWERPLSIQPREFLSIHILDPVD
jgi:hypothetical protein